MIKAVFINVCGADFLRITFIKSWELVAGFREIKGQGFAVLVRVKFSIISAVLVAVLGAGFPVYEIGRNHVNIPLLSFGWVSVLIG